MVGTFVAIFIVTGYPFLTFAASASTLRVQVFCNWELDFFPGKHLFFQRLSCFISEP